MYQINDKKDVTFWSRLNSLILQLEELLGKLSGFLVTLVTLCQQFDVVQQRMLSLAQRSIQVLSHSLSIQSVFLFLPDLVALVALLSPFHHILSSSFLPSPQAYRLLIFLLSHGLRSLGGYVGYVVMYGDLNGLLRVSGLPY
jgi:hypothetical protein